MEEENPRSGRIYYEGALFLYADDPLKNIFQKLLQMNGGGVPWSPPLCKYVTTLPADIGAYGGLERSGKVAWGLAWCSLLLPTLYCRFLSDQSSSHF